MLINNSIILAISVKVSKNYNSSETGATESITLEPGESVEDAIRARAPYLARLCRSASEAALETPPGADTPTSPKCPTKTLRRGEEFRSYPSPLQGKGAERLPQSDECPRCFDPFCSRDEFCPAAPTKGMVA
jgi:hypothetical protein